MPKSLPANAAALLDAAQNALRTGRSSDALQLLGKSLTIDPSQAEAHHLFGLLMARQGDLASALQHLGQATALAPARTDILINHATVCQHAGDLPQALSLLERARDLGAPQPELHFNLGVVRQGLGMFSDAADSFAEAAARRGDWPEAALSAGNCRLVAGDSEGALALLRTAHAAAPEHTVLASNLLLAMNYAASVGRHELRAAHAVWGEATRQASHHVDRVTGDRPAVRPRRLRLGFVSPDLGEHSVAFFLEPLLSHLSRQHFEAVAYTLRAKEDATSIRLRQKFDRWRNAHAADDTALAGLIANDRIDVLIDLAGHTAGNRLSLFARRLCRLQLSMIGYPTTTGLPSIDYCVSDERLDPASEHGGDYIEGLTRLPVFCCYRPPAMDIAPGPPPLLRHGHPTWGVFQSLAKITDVTLAMWAPLFARHPDARLIVQATGCRDPQAREALLARFATIGLAPERVSLRADTSLEEFLRAHQEVDACLDTLPWNGHTTTCHALWMGVPTLTCPGDRRAGRMGASLLEAVGLPTLVAAAPEAFAEVGSSLVSDAQRLADLRAGLRERLLNSPLCDGHAYARAFEAFIETAWAAH